MTEAVKTPYPRTFSHIGISVPDLEAAVKFYTEVLGWYLIMKPTEIVEDDSAIGEMCTDVFGPGWGKFRIAHLSTGDRVGVEIFEFSNQENPENNFEYWKTGIFHFCVQDPDVEGLAEKIVAAGGITVLIGSVFVLAPCPLCLIQRFKAAVGGILNHTGGS